MSNSDHIFLSQQVIYESSSDRAAAIVTSNVPYAKSDPDFICPPFDCDDLGWLDIYYPTDLNRGYTYCCTVQDLQLALPDNVPSYPTATLLTL